VEAYIQHCSPADRGAALQSARDALASVASDRSDFRPIAALVMSFVDASDSMETLEAGGRSLMLNPTDTFAISGSDIAVSGIGSTDAHIPYAAVYTEQVKPERGFSTGEQSIVSLGSSSDASAFTISWNVDGSTETSALQCLYRAVGDVKWRPAKHAAPDASDATKIVCEFHPALEALRSRRSTSDTDFAVGTALVTTTTTITTTITTVTSTTRKTVTTTKEIVTSTTRTTVTPKVVTSTTQQVDWIGEQIEASVTSADGKAASFGIDSKLLGAVAGIIVIVVVCLILGYRSIHKRKNTVGPEEHSRWVSEVENSVALHAQRKKSHLFMGIANPLGTDELKINNSISKALRVRELAKRWQTKTKESRSPQQGRLAPIPGAGIPGAVAQANPNLIAMQEMEEANVINSLTFNARSEPRLPPMRTGMTSPKKGVPWLPQQAAKGNDDLANSSSDSD
jgi:hypothetical protein